ncbi:phage tail protein [Pseudomonas aeruginosa]|uniref:phage tail-collar fiber domain-containing protein n=1 Tax=Pseudomonas aeruginosa TaxID=287 RepID=UPI001C1F3755|nr:phage tail protein [Pseudomonas aeruginosa]MBU8410847.1 phage tail protein [Pseudomonas aeruginosa]MCO2553679.1 phage tail protein [Pseudomonas aeruginosa]HBO1420028.1 phage tail protein [Pseudomonas aeruginosa]HBO4477910.1 phage tail protein [Pseudomonas aeruginosa]HCK5076586.1 phage tail protein [Pseudomonas aeruginosa]
MTTPTTPKYGGLLTDIGAAALIAASEAGKKWQPTHMLIGDAGGAPGETADPIPSTAQTKLIRQRYRAQLNRLFVSEQSANVLVAELVLPMAIGGFWIREIGLEDADGKFVAVANCPPSFKASVESGSARTQTIRVQIILSGMEHVELIIDDGIVYATQDWVTAKVAADFKGRKVLAGNGLVGGGDLSADRTIALPASGVAAGTYRAVTVNANGIVTAGSNPTTLAGNGITDAYTKAATDGLLAQKANKATTLGGYGITDAYTKTATDALLAPKADKATTLAGYGITDALHVSEAVTVATASKLLRLNAAGQLPASITGNATTANRLAAAITLSTTGDATWSARFDGSTSVSGPLILANTGVSPGTYPKVTVSAKGLVTAGSALAATDIPALDASKIATGRLELERLPLVSQGLATAVHTSVDPNSVVLPLVLTNHANGPGTGRYYYIQTMFYPTVEGNAVQIATGYANVADMYVRYAYSPTAPTDPNKREWSAWVRCDLGGAFAHAPDGVLGGGINLDSMIASGWWHQPFSLNAQNGANYPVGEAGILTVHAPTASLIYQTYRGYAAGGLYWRCRYNGTWGGWFRAWDSGNFNPSNYVAKSEYSWASLPGKPSTFPPSAHVHSAASRGVSGWYKNNDTGVIFQWVNLAIGDHPGTVLDRVVTFPIAFPNACLHVVPTVRENGRPAIPASTVTVAEKARTATNCTIVSSEYIGNVQNFGINVFAIGY